MWGVGWGRGGGGVGGRRSRARVGWGWGKRVERRPGAGKAALGRKGRLPRKYSKIEMIFMRNLWEEGEESVGGGAKEGPEERGAPLCPGTRVAKSANKDSCPKSWTKIESKFTR